MNPPKIAIVAPCHIPPTADWVSSLEREAKLAKADVFIIDDSDGKLGPLPAEWRVYDYAKQKEFLGELYDDFANIFHKSSSCRNLGHIIAYSEGYEFIIGVDSDCVVPFFFVQAHLAVLNKEKGYGWQNPLGGSGMYPRGFPYSMRNWRIVANMGMWDNVLDLNGKDRRPDEPKRVNMPGYNIAPAPIPFSGMNFAITGDSILGFFFLPNFKSGDDDHRRIDDIWGGYIFQKLLHKMKRGVSYGRPIVFHDTVVIASEDAAEEAAMYKNEDAFMKEVDSVANNMCLVVTDMTVMSDLMKDFITTWEIDVEHGTFVELTKAFQWWEKVINKIRHA